MRAHVTTIASTTAAFLAAAAIGYVAVQARSGGETTDPTPTDTVVPEAGTETGERLPVVFPVSFDGDIDEAIAALSEQAAVSRAVAADLGISLEPAARSGIVLHDAPPPGRADDAPPPGTAVPSSQPPDTTIPATTLATGSPTTSAVTPGEETPPGTFGLDRPRPTSDGSTTPGEETPPGTFGLDDRATDTCTEDGEGCPDGVPGTILSVHAAPPLAGVAIFDPPAPGTSLSAWEPVCPTREPREGTAYFGVVTNRPAIITMEYRTREWRPERGAVDWTEFTVSTSDAADEAWESWLADDTAPIDDPASLIYTCFELEGLAPRDDYQARFTFTAKDDPSMTATNWVRIVPFTVAAEGGLAPGAQRRPTTLLPLGIDQLFVGTTRTPDQEVAVVARPGNDPASCEVAGDRAAIFGGEDTVAAWRTSETPIDRDVLDDPAYPYLRDHSISVVDRLDLEEGTQYVVCVYWLEDGPAFDPTVVVEAEAVTVSTPEAYRPTVVVERLTNLVTDAQRVDITFPQCGGRSVSYDLTEPSAIVRNRAGARMTTDDPVEVCTMSRRLNEINRRGIRVNMTVQQADGTPVSDALYIRTNVACRTAPCLLRLDELAMVPLPTIYASSCGSGPGFGRGCLGGTISAGDAAISIRFDPTAGSGESSWTIGEPAPFEDAPPPLPDTPRIEVTRTYELIDGHPTGGARARLTFTADRPVSLDVSVTESPGTDEPCPLGPADGYRQTTRALTHTVTIEPLCLGHGYRLDVLATDAEGTLAEVVGEVPPSTDNTVELFVPPVTVTTERSISITTPDEDHSHTVYVYPARATGRDVTGSVATDLYWTWPRADVEAAGRSGWQLFGVEGRANACGEPGAGPLEVFARRTATAVPIRASLPAPQTGVRVRVVVEIYANRPVGGPIGECVPGELEERVELSSLLSLEDLFDGVTMVSDSGRVRFTIRGTDYRRELVG